VDLKTKTEHKHTPEEERRIREAALDETLKETFAASDPPSTIPDPDNDEALERFGTESQNEKAEANASAFVSELG
jgi:hypothetical protein